MTVLSLARGKTRWRGTPSGQLQKAVLIFPLTVTQAIEFQMELRGRTTDHGHHWAAVGGGRKMMQMRGVFLSLTILRDSEFLTLTNPHHRAWNLSQPAKKDSPDFFHRRPFRPTTSFNRQSELSSCSIVAVLARTATYTVLWQILATGAPAALPARKASAPPGLFTNSSFMQV